MLFRSESLGGALGVYLPASGLVRLNGLVRNVVLAWLISEGQFGLLVLALLAINVLLPAASLGLHEAVGRYVPLFETRGALRAYLRRTTPLVLVVSVVSAGLLASTAESVGGWLFNTLDRGPSTADTAETAQIASLTRWVAAALFSLTWYFYVVSILRGLRMFRAIGLTELCTGLLFTASAVMVAFCGAKTAKAVIISYAGSMLLMLVLVALGLRSRLRAWPEQSGALEAGEPVVTRMLRFSVWAAFAAMMWHTLQSYPTWYLNKIHGETPTAIFGGIRLLTQVGFLAAMAIITVVTMSVTKSWEAEGQEVANRRYLLAFKATACMLLIVSVVTVMAARPLMWLLPANFARGREVIPLLLLFSMLCAELSFLGIQFTLIEKARLLFYPWAFGVAANVALAAVWVRPATAQPSLSMSEQLLPSAQAGVVAMTGALAVCLLLLLIRRRPIDRGAWILLAAGFALCLPVWAMVAVLLVVALLGPSVLFSRDERAEIRRRTGQLIERLRRRPGTTES